MWETFIIQPMLNTLLWIYTLLGQNFGLSIILFTILVRLILYPITAQQQKSAQAMQELQNSKKWKEINKKYKDDKEKLAAEQMKLYQEMGVSPFGSCLPSLVQFPIIIGLYQAVIRALADTPLPLLHLSKSLYPFVDSASLIPLNSHFLWMDLGQPERLNVAGIGIPVLAILVVITTYLQTKLMAMPTSGDNAQAAQMTGMMNVYMPLMLGYFAYAYASGLALYFVASNIMTVVQYAAMGKLDWSKLLPSSR
ncbi:MAG: membrane protein insertase YidC [Anaerolineae bacterium]|nr:MAG: membrane protein insertase YidC [Anaerolineae bacterium]